MEKKIKHVALAVLTVFILAGCDFINNAVKYKNTTEAFTGNLIKEDYTACLKLMALDSETAKNTNTDSLKTRLANFRKFIVDNWGTELDYSHAKAEKKFSTNTADNTPPNATLVFVEFSNKKDFGVLRVLFDDTSGQILNINTLNIKAPVPTMTFFWLFGLLALCIPAFNIYVIRQIKRSGLTRKWLKYMGVIFLNIPAITYAAVAGLSFKLLSIQLLLGISFNYGGFLESHWTFGIPLGGLYWFWKLKKIKSEAMEAELPDELTPVTKPPVGQ